MPLYLLLPLASAVLYTVGSLFLKQALHAGASVRQTSHANNLIVGACSLPLLLFEDQPIAWRQLHQPVIVGGCFYAGALFNTIAIRRGDISLVNPVLGTKAVMVAAGAVVFIGDPLPAPLWAGAVLSALGIFLIGAPAFSGKRPDTGLLLPLALALGCAASFALADVFVTMWAGTFSPLAFIALMSVAVALLSCLLNPILLRGGDPAGRKLADAPPASRRPLYLGATCIGLQAAIIGVALCQFGDPTGINIVYSSRGLWAIAVVWVFASSLARHESTHRQPPAQRRRTLAFRLAGTTVLTAGIIAAVVARSA